MVDQITGTRKIPVQIRQNGLLPVFEQEQQSGAERRFEEEDRGKTPPGSARLITLINDMGHIIWPIYHMSRVLYKNQKLLLYFCHCDKFEFIYLNLN